MKFPADWWRPHATQVNFIMDIARTIIAFPFWYYSKSLISIVSYGVMNHLEPSMFLFIEAQFFLLWESAHEKAGACKKFDSLLMGLYMMHKKKFHHNSFRVERLLKRSYDYQFYASTIMSLN